MDLRTYFRSLDPRQQTNFAKKAGTTVSYIRCHLICDPPNKIPRPKLLAGLAAASGGSLTRDDLIRYFYGQAA